MTVYESIETRKSIRDFEKRPVEPEKLQRILEAGRLAPTARCSNATRFIVGRSRPDEEGPGGLHGSGSDGQGSHGCDRLLGQHPGHGL